MRPKVFKSVLFCLGMATVPMVVAGCSPDVGTSVNELVLQARAHFDRGQMRAALIEAKNAVRVEPENAGARLILGQVHAGFGDGPSAEKELKRALELGIAPTEVQADLARAYLLQGKYREVIDEENNIAVADHSAAVTSADAKRLAEVLALRGHAYLLTDQLAVAENRYGQALKLDGDSLEARLGEAWLAARQGNNGLARERLETLLQAEPQFGAAWSLLGDVSRAEGDTVAAAKAYSEAIKARANHTTDLVSRAGYGRFRSG